MPPRRFRPGTLRGLGLFAAALAISAAALPRIAPAAETGTLDLRIAAGADDVEETATRYLDTASSDLELTVERTAQTIGLRFAPVPIPSGVTITTAWLQFTVDEVGSAATALVIRAQDAGDAAAFSGPIGSRPLTVASVPWSPPPWTAIGASGPDQRTPDLATLLQAVVSRPDWAPGNALALVLTGSGTRTAESFEGSSVAAPLLHVEWTTSTTVPTTTTTTAPPGSGVTEIRVGAGGNDVEQLGNGWVYTGSSDLELVKDGAIQIVGLRFPTVPIPRNAVIRAAWIRFTVDETSTGAAALQVELQDAGDAAPFTGNSAVSARPRTASVTWVPEPWLVPGTSSDHQRTPDLSSLVQAVVSRPDWSPGSALAAIFTGTGTRTAVAHEASPSAAALLHIEWSTGPSTTTVPTTTSTTPTTTQPATTTTAPTTTTSPTTTLPPTTTTVLPTTTTAPSAGGTVRLAVIGDYGSGNARQGQVADMIEASGVSAVVTTGDNVYASTGFDRLVGRYYHQFIGAYAGAYGTGSTTNRFFPSLGNHDYIDVGLEGYLAFFTLPGPGVGTLATSGNERYYDARLGRVHLFVVNSQPEEPDGLSPDSVQGLWLRNALAASDAEWKLVVFHNPPYSSIPGKSAGWMRWPFAAWGADLVLNGDAHVYERLRVDGFDYVISGLGINHSPAEGPLHYASQVLYSTDDAGALFITACQGALLLEYRALAAGVVDTYALGSGTCP